MEILLNRKYYNVRWRHVPPGREEEPGTYCFMTEQGQEMEDGVGVKATLYAKDQFNRANGRRYSLLKLLHAMGMGRQDRVRVFRAYDAWCENNRKPEKVGEEVPA